MYTGLMSAIERRLDEEYPLDETPAERAESARAHSMYKGSTPSTQYGRNPKLASGTGRDQAERFYGASTPRAQKVTRRVSARSIR